MGCTRSLPPEYKPPPSKATEHTITEPQTNPSSLNPTSPLKTDYERVLSSPGQLEVPDKFKKWFPPRHGHSRIRDLFTFHNEIGHGVTSSVHEIEYKSQICAVKQIEKNDQWGRMLFETEAQVLSKLSHGGIIRFIDMFFDEKYYYLVLEKADFDLYYVMQKKGHLSEKKTRNIVYSILKSLKYMHRKNLAHRDLKPENIVFIATDTNNPRLIDFGDTELARKDQKYTEFVGTPPYMSPERLDEHHGWQLKKADIWAIAVIAYEMYCGKRCFIGDTQKQVFACILRGEWSWPKERNPTHQFKDFIEQCLQHNAKDRPNAKQALNHPWFDVKRKEEEEDTDDEEHVVQKIKDITEVAIFDNVASMVQNNPLQDILVNVVNIDTQDALTPYQEQFDALDIDCDGYITGPDLVTRFTNNGIGSHQASSLASILLSLLDINRCGKISFNEFLSARFTYDIANRSKQIFNDIVTVSPEPAWKHREEKKGISQQDIIVYSKSYTDLSVNREELKALFCKYDKDGDGRLTYNDFAEAVQSTAVVDTEVNVPSNSDKSIQRRRLQSF